MILFFVILPIVFRVVNEKSKVMKGFAYVKKKEIGDILSWASAFDIKSSFKSLKLLAENRKEKVYEMMNSQKEKQVSVIISKKEEPVPEPEVVIPEDPAETEAQRSMKLRDLIRKMFKFEAEEDKKQPALPVDSATAQNNGTADAGSVSGMVALNDSKNGIEEADPSPKNLNPSKDNLSKGNNGNTPPNEEPSSVLDPIMKEEKGKEESFDEKIYLQRKKQSLARTE